MSATRGEVLDDAARAAIHDAMRKIAARCDGAKNLDGEGFSGPHAKFGAMVAGLPTTALSDRVLASCWEILRSYRRQLAECGVDFDSLPRPPGAIETGRAVSGRTESLRSAVVRGSVAELHFGYDPDLNGMVRHLLGGTFDDTRSAWLVPVSDGLQDFVVRFGFTVAHEDPPASNVPAGRLSVQHDGRLVVKITGYRPDLHAKLKAIPAGRLDTSTRHTVFSSSAIRPLLAFAARHGLDVDDGVRRVPDVPQVSARVEAGDLVVSVTQYDVDVVQVLRERLGARYRHQDRTWRLELGQAPELADELRWLGRSTDLDVAAVAAHKARMDEIHAASFALDGDVELPDWFGMELRPFQRGGVAYMAEHRRCFLIDSTGGGKTVQSLATVAATDSFPVLIVCKSKLKLVWAREARRALPGKHVAVLSGVKPHGFGLWRPDVVIVNFDVAHAWASTIVRDLGARALIVDESHLVKGEGNRRTEAVQVIADAIEEGGVKLNLSATPTPSHRREYAEQLRILGRLEEFGGAVAVAQDPNIAWRLRASGALIGRKTSDYAPDLPPVEWQLVPLEADRAAMSTYRRAEADLLEFLAGEAAAAALDAGTDPRDAAESARMRAQRAKHLIRINALRRLSAKAKLAAAKEWIADYLDGVDDKILVFAHHLDVLDSVRATFGCPSIQGGMSDQQTQRIVDDFQAGQGRVLAMALTAGAEGLTLTQAQAVAFLEQAWTPGGFDQAIGRVYGRINDLHGAAGIVFILEGTIDEWMAELIDEKRVEVANATFGTEREDVGGKSSIAGALIDRMVRAAVAGKRTLAA